jgi:DNA-binding beta-propeller fold protein YncE
MLIAFVFVIGCAAPPPRPEEPEIVWPPPPDIPRIKYIRSYTDTLDVEAPPGFLEIITGIEFYSLVAPQGIAADREGNIYVADSTEHVIVVFQPEKRRLRLMGDRDPERVLVPLGLAVDNKQNMLLVASSGTQKVIGYDINTGAPRLAIRGFQRPVSVAVDEVRKRIYVTDSKASELKAYDMGGKYISTIATAGTEDHQLLIPGQVALDRQGNIYVADTFNFKVKVFSPEGKFLKAIGRGVGDKPGYFSKLSGVAVDSEGHIYAIDTDFSNFQIFDQEGRVLLVVGSDGTLRGLNFRLPLHIYIDEKDRIYVADTFNSRVQVFQYLKE